MDYQYPGCLGPQPHTKKCSLDLFIILSHTSGSRSSSLITFPLNKRKASSVVFMVDLSFSMAEAAARSTCSSGCWSTSALSLSTVSLRARDLEIFAVASQALMALAFLFLDAHIAI